MEWRPCPRETKSNLYSVVLRIYESVEVGGVRITQAVISRKRALLLPHGQWSIVPGLGPS